MKNSGTYKRNEIIEKLQSTSYDVLIIGGGITGAGIALDAASRGLKTALIEKQDFAAGTSSRSTKLIHGGLRYLKNMELGLVREVGRERKILLQLARHLVMPENMLLPIHKHGNLNKTLTSLALWMYDMLTQVRPEERKKILSKAETLETEPLLKSENIIGSGLYTEYRTDDARLTIENLKTAASYGADCINYFSMEAFTYSNEKINGIECQDLLTGNITKIKSGIVVNASGPWVDVIRRKDHIVSGKKLHHTKGIHLVFEKHKFPIRHSIYFDTNDKRMMFAIPRADKVYVGTTDTNYNENLENPNINEDDIQYILNSVNSMFNNIHLEKKDIVSSWAGIRPLIHEDNKAPSELSRKDEIFISESGLISIAGGKLTAYRKMAEKTVNIIVNKLNLNLKCITKQIPLHGCDFETAVDASEYVNNLQEKQLPENRAEKLFRLYGKQTDIILKKASEFLSADQEENIIRAEVWFAMNYEYTIHAEDFFIRRSARMYFEPQSVAKYLSVILEDMKTHFIWNEEQTKKEKENIINILKKSTFTE